MPVYDSTLILCHMFYLNGTSVSDPEILYRMLDCVRHIYFYAPGLKGPPGASSVWIVCPSVRLSVRLFVRLSVRNSVPLTFKVQYFKFGWSYSNQTWTESPSMDCSHFTDITCPWGWGRVKIWDLEILPYFDFVAAGGIRVSQTHV